MSDIVHVGPDEPRPTHHISLYNGKDAIGIILCDRNGTPTPLNIREIPVPKTVLKTSTGPGGYSDFEYPYTPIVQEDWAGGAVRKISRKIPRATMTVTMLTPGAGISCQPH
jgi:hypothetical protein